jgi:hypothetical protein
MTFAQNVKIRNYVILIKAKELTIEDVEIELQEAVISKL